MDEDIKSKISEYAVVDLFCGVGGLTQGFVQEGFHIAAGIDFDESCRFAFEYNNDSRFIHKNVAELLPSELEKIFPQNKKKILVGCAPCQPYSIFNRKKGSVDKEVNDSRWLLLSSFANLIDKIRPEIISMENVPLLKNFRKGQVFNDFLEVLKNAGYHLTYDIYNAQNYGVPQRRKRLVLIGSLEKKIEMLNPTCNEGTYVTVREAIGQLPVISDGVTHENDPLHRSRRLSELSKRRIRATKEGGSWVDWDEDLKLTCHKGEGGKIYKSVYGRMKWDDVAPTMTTYCTGLNNGRFGHPEQDRAISLREAALIQSFPPDYKFFPSDVPLSMPVVSRHIGNAVPVLLGRAIAKSIKDYIETL